MEAHYSKEDHEDGFNGVPLRQVDTISSISITPEQFERMYLSPQNKVSGDLRKTFGNPTPVGLGGFLIALTPLVIQFMGWRGTIAANGLPTFGSYIFLGGVVALLASIGEFILGNTFPCIFFGVYGGFFLTYGVTVIPFFGAVTTFAPAAEVAALSKEGLTGTALQSALFAAGAKSVEFNASVGFLSTFLAAFTLIMLVASFRTNIFFVGAFFALLLTFTFFAVAKFYAADGNAAAAMTWQIAAGAAGFATCMFGWWLLTVEVLAAVDFPVNLPVFDLSGVVPSGTDIAKRKRGHNANDVAAMDGKENV